MSDKKIIFTIRVYGKEPAHESHESQLAHIDDSCRTAVQNARSAGGTKLAGVAGGHGGIPVAEWEYSPGEMAR
jgi:hypothetical protein